jgi:hypothetical protein
MYGKHFASMYEGSMRGAGSAFFAVWGYIISHMKPNRKHGTTVEINPDIVAFLLGEKPDVVRGVIAKMCGPDPRSRTEDKGGRKLVKLAEYTYHVVNGDYYRSIRNEEERREYQRIKQAGYRAKKTNRQLRGRPGAATGEAAYVRAEQSGASQKQLDALAAEGLK